MHLFKYNNLSSLEKTVDGEKFIIKNSIYTQNDLFD